MGIKGWLDRLGRRGEGEASPAAPPDAPPPGAPTPGAPSTGAPNPGVRPAAPLPASAGLGFALVDDMHGDEACVGCGLCATICPPGVISLEPGAVAPSPVTGRRRGWLASMTIAPAACIACELCMQVCPTDALRLFPDMRTPAASPERPVLDHAGLREARARVRLGRRRSPLGPMPGPPGASSPAPPRTAPRRPRPAVGLGTPLHRVPEQAELPTDEDRTRLEPWRDPRHTELPTEPVGAAEGDELWTEDASAFEPTPALPDELLPGDAPASGEPPRRGAADTLPLPPGGSGRSGPADTAPMPGAARNDRDN